MVSKPLTIDLKTREPSVFIGSSTEALEYAEAIKAELQDVASLKLWNECIWRPGKPTLENLINLLPDYDFAVFILDAEDVISSRGVVSDAPRDNIIFELGLFMGHLGRDRTFFLYKKGMDLKLPSDLQGTTYIPFAGKPDEANKAVAGACKIIRQEIKIQGVFELFQSGTLIERFRMASWKEIYLRAIKLVSQAQTRVRATSFGTPQISERLRLEYFETLAKRAAAQKNRQVDFVYKAIYSKRKADSRRNSGLRDRRKLFEKHGVFDCIQAREIAGDWRVDLLIVDNKSMHLSFQGVRGHSLALGLEIVDAEELVHPIATWYDECLFDRARPVNWNNLC